MGGGGEILITPTADSQSHSLSYFSSAKLWYRKLSLWLELAGLYNCILTLYKLKFRIAFFPRSSKVTLREIFLAEQLQAVRYKYKQTGLPHHRRLGNASIYNRICAYEVIFYRINLSAHYFLPTDSGSPEPHAKSSLPAPAAGDPGN